MIFFVKFLCNNFSSNRESLVASAAVEMIKRQNSHGVQCVCFILLSVLSKGNEICGTQDSFSILLPDIAFPSV